MRRIGASVIERVTQACVCASLLLAPVAATQAATEEDPWESQLPDALISQDLHPTRGQHHVNGAWLWGDN